MAIFHEGALRPVSGQRPEPCGSSYTTTRMACFHSSEEVVPLRQESFCEREWRDGKWCVQDGILCSKIDALGLSDD